MTCEHCGSDRHRSEDCPALHLTRFLLGKDDYDIEKLPDLVAVTDEENLVDTIEEAHAIQHLFNDGVSTFKHRRRTI